MPKNWYDEANAENESGGRFTGLHKVKIIEAEAVSTDNNAAGIKLKLAFLDRKNEDGEPKQITIDTVWLSDRNGKKPDADRIMALFQICKADPKKIKKVKAERYDFDTREKATKAVSMYEDLIGKTVVMFIQFQMKYPLTFVDPTESSLPKLEVGMDNGIWIPNYSKPQKMHFVFIRAFYPDSLKTFSENKNNSEAKIHKELFTRYNDINEDMLAGNDLIKLIKKKCEEKKIEASPDIADNIHVVYYGTDNSSNNDSGDVPF